MRKIAARPVFLAVSDRCARTSLADSWKVSWSFLLQGARRFDFPKQTLSDWPDDAPVACLQSWAPGFELAGRAPQLANALGRDTKFLHDQLLRANPDIRLTILVATSHGESYAVSEFAEYTTGRSPALPRSVAEAVLCDRLLAAFLDGMGTVYSGATVSAACASACIAAGFAAERIRSDLCDACFVVSLDVISRIAHAGFQQIGAMSRLGCRPFDRRRDGTTIGEGGAVVLFVGADVVLPAWLRCTVKVAGFGQSCDARHPVEPSADGICEALQRALADAGCVASDLAAVYWHGTGTIQNDRAEAEAARKLFGAAVPPGTTTKGAFGHTMGASSALSMLAAAETVKSHLLPPVAGLEDIEFRHLNLVTETFAQVNRGPVAVVALGFGGINGALVLTSNRGEQ